MKEMWKLISYFKTYNGALKSRTLAISFSTLLAPKEAPQQTIDNYKYYPYK